ncbi:BTB/POZ domain-containing protein 2 [Orchesella cincta]|uniref:BTB/POZ domain-containing protein 2 n=1 Tax=Orchesella cincta TaxID=48709 RepID=A0A1D2NFR3_ORCCI|nr:BTB/POZ domain-containing protein 2 [Orchesella cincta]
MARCLPKFAMTNNNIKIQPIDESMMTRHSLNNLAERRSSTWSKLELDTVETRVEYVAKKLEDPRWEGFHDIVFHVGSEVITPIKSSKLLLSISLPYFEKLFATSGKSSIKDDEELEEERMEVGEERAAEFKPEIVVFRDFEPDPFKAVLQSLVGGKRLDLADKDFDYIFEVVKIGQHINYLDIIKQCNVALGPFATMEGACKMINRVFCDPKAQEKELSMCRSYVQRFQEKLIRSKAFLNLSQQAVLEILKTDLQKIEEIDIFNAVIRWAKFNIDQKGEVTIEDGVKLRKALGDILYEIRFTCMSPEQIVELAKSTNVLNSSEVVNFIMFINGCNGIRPSVGQFKTEPRSGDN